MTKAGEIMKKFVVPCLTTLMLASPALAQPVKPPAVETALPIQMKMLYLKLLNRQPDYEAVIRENPTYQKDPNRFANATVMEQQRKMLQSLYDQAGTAQKILVRKPLQFTNVDPDQRTAILKDPGLDDPVVFRLGEGDTYALFIRNFADIKNLAAPYEFDDFENLMGTAMGSKPVPAILTIQPIAADPEDFVLNTKEKVHVILGRVTALSFEQKNGERLLLDKRFDAKPALPIPTPVSGPVPAAGSDHKALPPATVTQ